ncbi:hypothetical protein [Geoalkalibacter sp.]|uniref:hypothetical protein n=1 Tax=Geoalkalibacter sp. TaxID=3041440 RepID=UPI00272E0183|nr:hypothetical protein [Geoalkalibacter sp.]
MTTRLVALSLCALLFLCGCAGVKIVPQPGEGSQVNLAEGSITQVKNNLSLSVRVQDLEVRPYQRVDNLVSFHVAAVNSGNQELNLSLGGFFLVDETGRQATPLTPAKVQEMIARDSFYLIPYPYVGYYYLKDAVRVSQAATFDSSLPYFPQRFPQTLHTEALPESILLPGSRVSGLIYFVADLTRMKSFELRYFMPDSSLSGEEDFRFPFSVEKN